jgi:hypothetical protein
MPMTSSRRQERSDDEIRSMISPSQSTTTCTISRPEAQVDSSSCYGRGGRLLLSDDTLFGMPLFFERLHQDRKRRKMGNTFQRDDPRKQGPGPDGNTTTTTTTTARRQQRSWTRPTNIDTTPCHVAATAPAAPRPPPAPRNAHVKSKLARESPCSVVPDHCMITRKAFTFF